jgi:hypothetical protein
MPATLTIRDEGLGAQEQDGSFELTVPGERLTIRELIRERVYQEVDDFNRKVREGNDARFKGLVRPAHAEAVLNATGSGRREVDWKAQFEQATRAFLDRRVLVLVGERQATELEEPFDVTPGLEVAFLRLVPLVGG